MRRQSPLAVAESFELRGRTRACASLVDVANRDVLNVGSSIGWFERNCLEQGARHVVGVDVTCGNLEVAGRFAPEADFVVASALELPFEDSSFDVVALLDVLEHLPRGREPQALAEIRRVLRPGGSLALSTPHRHWFPTFTDPAYYLGHRHYSVPEVERLVREADLHVSEVRVAGRLFDQLDLLAYYASRHLLGRERHPLAGVRRRADREWDDAGGWNTILLVASAPGLSRSPHFRDDALRQDGLD